MKIDLTKIKDAAGNPIDASKVDPTVLAVIGAIGPAIAETIKAATEPLTTKAAELENKLAEFAKAPPTSTTPNPDPKGKPGDPNPTPPAPNPEIEALKKQVEQLTASITGEQTAARLTQQAQVYIAKNLPNISPAAKERLVKSIVAGTPKDEAGIKAIIDDKREELIALGADKANPFGVTPTAEGGRPVNPDAAKAEERAKLDGLDKRLEEKRRVG